MYKLQKQLNRYEFTHEDSIKGGNAIAGKPRPGRRVSLTEEDWLSHMLHLASMKFNIEDNVRGCRVCKWYNGLSSQTQRSAKECPPRQTYLTKP